jgi:hypothetical protein
MLTAAAKLQCLASLSLSNFRIARDPTGIGRKGQWGLKGQDLQF